MVRSLLIRTVVVSLACFAGAIAFGCQCPPRPCEVEASAPPATHLIFNPDPSGETVALAHESDWPATYNSTHLGESTDFMEVIYDRQGTYWHDQDRYDRRFRSVRTGSTRR